jgi:arylsulfatase A-like enzyme
LENKDSIIFLTGAFVLPILVLGMFLIWVEKQKKPAMARNRHNVIFITVDTLRADHTPFLKYSRQTLPNTYAFFQQGINFTAAQTVRTSTTPAYASMLTGLYPYHHGVRNLYFPLNQQVTTLQEVLKKQNILTAGFVSSFAMMDKFSGLKQGFDVYDDFVFTKELNRENYERIASDTIRRVLSWLDAKNQQFFLFIHLIDPHGPYHPPNLFRDHFKSSQIKILERGVIPNYQYLPGELNLYRYIDFYDGEILYLDAQLKALYQAFLEKGLIKNSWFLFTADHGESLSEHGRYFEHGFNCYEAESRIPFVWLPPERLRLVYKPAQKEYVVSLVDVVPTVLDLLGIESNLKLDGESLVPVFRGSQPKSPFRFIEKHSEGGDTVALRISNAKLILNRFRSNAVYEYYDLSKDSDEKNNLIEADMSAPPSLIDVLDAHGRAAANYQLPFSVHEIIVPSRKSYVRDHILHELADDDAEKLRALGYLD